MDGSSTRAPGERPLRIAIIGAGLSGIMGAIKLHEAGIDDVVVYEKASSLGGTWRDNRYPGIACDIPSHFYSYSFAPNPDWSRQYASGEEILAYIERVARDFDVARCIRFSEEVQRLTFDEGRWQIETARGTRDVADVVIAATGVLHHPNVPDLPGLSRFQGAAFHTARWDPSVAIDGRRVGVIGTGSTAVQLVSALVGRVEKLSLFQRTAQWISPQENFPFSDEDRATFRRDPEALRKKRENIARKFVQKFSDVLIDSGSGALQGIEETCRQYLESEVKDPVLRERLRPTYRAACKRLVISPDFYQAIQHPSAELVTDGIDRIEPEGVRTRDGRLHELDVLVFATGFRSDRFLRPMDVRGREGRSLDEAWAKRPSAYLTVAIPGFPNLFMLNGPNGPVGNYPLIDVAELQMQYILQLVALLKSGACRALSPREEAAARFEEERVTAARSTVWMTGCTSWYLDDRGVPSTWPWTIERFRQQLAAPELDAYEQLR